MKSTKVRTESNVYVSMPAHVYVCHSKCSRVTLQVTINTHKAVYCCIDFSPCSLVKVLCQKIGFDQHLSGPE